MQGNDAKADAELKVFISSRDSKCDECGSDLGRHAWIILRENKGALCLSCADLDHLVFLPSGDATLTRRARKHSGLSAVVLKWSSARKRYERQGLLVENSAIERAEKECADDADVRAVRQAQAAVRLAELDQEYVAQFAARVRALFPNCPTGRERIIAEHACRKYSGRVGRSAAAKAMDEKAVRLAVAAHIRHTESNYDTLLLDGHERYAAREEVRDQVAEVLTAWGNGKSMTCE